MTNHQLQRNIIFFDIESTGTSSTKDRIIELSAIKTSQSLEVLESKKILVNPNFPIHPEASKVHGFYEADLALKPTFAVYAKGIRDWFSGNDLCAYNGKRFDIPMLVEELLRCDLVLDLSNINIIDPYLVFTKNEPRTLTAAYKFYCGKELEGAHAAEVDNLATIEVLKAQMFFYGLSLPDCIEIAKSGSEKNVDFAGKIVLNDDGVAVWSFGKNVNRPVAADKGYCDWVLSGDFSLNTKNVVKSIIGAK